MPVFRGRRAGAIVRQGTATGHAAGISTRKERGAAIPGSNTEITKITKDRADGVRSLLRELAGLLVSVPGGEEDSPARRTGVSVERTAQVSGLQAILLPVLTAPLLLLVPPTEPLGDAGWVVAAVALLTVVALGFRLIRPPVVSGPALAATNAYAAFVLGVLAWLGGGFASPFPLLLILVAASIAPHPPALRRGLLAWLVLVAAAPLAYDEVTDRNVAEALMIAATSAGTLVTMLWLSARVRRSEVGLMDAASVAERERERAERRAGHLEELGVRRERLVTSVSHELRTPLTSIRGYLEAMLEGESGELGPEQRDYAAVALRNTERLERLIGDLLLLSSVEAGQVTLRHEPIVVGQSLRRLCEELAPIARRRGIRIDVADAGQVAVTADPARLEQALTNLISNAVKYSPEGATVRLAALMDDGEALIEVADSGVGIPQEELERIGERFFRASTAGDAPGTGLGIAIARELVELHGGRLEAESVVGKGSTFRIRLPASPAPR